MEKTSIGYCRPTDDEFAELWQNCLFVLDANVLLNLYRWPPETSQEWIGILKQISDRLWVPHQVDWEYQRHRPGVIKEQTKIYDQIRGELQRVQTDLKNKLNAMLGSKRRRLVDQDRLLEAIDSAFAEAEKELDRGKQKHPDLSNDDYIGDAIASLLEGKVGSPYKFERLGEVFLEGPKRYEHKIPPGYKDAEEEQGFEAYGDLILWYQIMDKAKETKTPIIFVTDDRKEDWWWVSERKTIGPRPELLKEIRDYAGVSFYMYRPAQFMEYAQKCLGLQVKQETIDEVREIERQQAEEVLQRMAEMARYPTVPPDVIKRFAEMRLPTISPDVIQSLAEAKWRIPIPADAVKRIAEALRYPSAIPTAWIQQLAEAAEAARYIPIPAEVIQQLYETVRYPTIPADLMRELQKASMLNLIEEAMQSLSELNQEEEDESSADEADSSAQKTDSNGESEENNLSDR
jgi:hypothetical protein